MVGDLVSMVVLVEELQDMLVVIMVVSKHLVFHYQLIMHLLIIMEIAVDMDGMEMVVLVEELQDMLVVIYLLMILSPSMKLCISFFVVLV